jgi:lipopolysaccharide transport system permease protein
VVALQEEGAAEPSFMKTIISANKPAAHTFKELWSYKELFYFFAWRDIKVRYKQTAIGASWAIIQPFITMVVFTLFFNRVAGISSGSELPYPIFSYSGLLLWGLFSVSLTQASNSLVANQAVITKIYFPRIVAPISATLLGLVDFFFASIVFAGLMVYYHISPGLQGLLLLIPVVLLTMATAIGVGLFFAALNVKYRDVKAAIPFVIQLGLFLTPVIYPTALVPQRFQWLVNLNPMAGAINALRAGLLGQGSVNWGSLGISALVALVLLVLGYMYFSKTEREFADII